MTSQTPATGPRRDGAAHCAECGTRAEPGQSFCDSCGAVLGWVERAADGDTSAAADGGAPERGAPVAATTEPGDPERRARASGRTSRDAHDAGTAAPGAPEPGAAEPGAAGSGAAGSGSGGDQAAVTAALPSGASEAAPVPADTARARSLLVPVADPAPRETAAPAVVAVLPGRPVADRPQVRTPGREAGAEGGVPCPWCATPNRPDRHFCVLCAMPLAAGPAAPGARLTWWRRVLDFRNRETPWAGDRPRLRRGFGYLMTWVLWALALALLITAVVQADNAYNAVRDHFAKRTPVAPDSVAASRSYEGHEPQLTFDKLNNTWWGPGITQSAAGEWVEARFDRPTRLLDVIITPGTSTRADKLSQSALPHRVEAVITTSDGRTVTRFLTLDQGAGGQRRTFRVGEVTAVRFVLRSAHAAAADKQVAVAEIEFFGPSNGGRSQ